MTKFILGFILMSSSSAFAVDIDVSAGTAVMKSPTEIQIANVKLGNLLPTVTVNFKWNSVSSSFVLLNETGQQTPNGDLIGKWDTEIQNQCTGSWSKWAVVEFLQNGTCIHSGMNCTWQANGNGAIVKWSNYPNYTNQVEVINNQMTGTIVDASSKWCWRGNRI